MLNYRSIGSSGRSRCSKSGITLIEILVVIAIIAIIAAILLPVIINSKESARQSQCISNLKQFGCAFQMYIQDWDEWLPGPGGLNGNYAYWSQTGFGGLESYIKQSGVGSVWCCPNLKDWNGRYAARSYSMNSYLRNPADVEYPTCIYLLCGANANSIEEPGMTILLFEGLHLASGVEDSIDYIYRCGNWTCVSGFMDGIAYTQNSGKPWHRKVNNYLYCDGHIKARTPGKKTVGTRSTWYEMREWYVSKSYFYSRYGETAQ